MNGRPESFQTPPPQTGNVGPGVEPGLEENLISIDVPDAGDHSLIEEKALQPAAAAPEPVEKGGKVEHQRLGPEVADFRRPVQAAGPHSQDETELADIVKAQLLILGPEGDGQVHVLIQGQRPRANQQLSGHLEVDDHGATPGKIQQDQLPPPPHPCDALTSEPLER